MPDEHYLNPKLADIYDFDSGWSQDREFYLSLADGGRKSILDLGCGTGLLCNAYAERNHDVVGVDPSAAMLDVARRKPNGARIEWILSDAQNFATSKRFDLIIMTGHAFQVLMDDDDVVVALRAMRHHLKDDGLIVFESRNPSIDWSTRWDYEMNLDLPNGSVIESRRLVSFQNERMKFELQYRFPDEVLVSDSELRFMSAATIERCIDNAQLRVQKLVGDWDGSAFDPGCSEEMIFFVGRNHTESRGIE